VVSEAKNLRKCDAGAQKGSRAPNVMANLRIIEKNSARLKLPQQVSEEIRVFFGFDVLIRALSDCYFRISLVN
jgi:hypothetical protein